MGEVARTGWRRYLRAAIKEPWNLGLLFAGLGFAALSPFPDALIPIVMGVEGLYLMGMAGHPRFRDAVDAQIAKSERQAGAISSTQLYMRLLDQLDSTDQQRFRRLVMRCQGMQSLSSSLPGGVNATDANRQSSLDRLLFFYLRLLVTRGGLKTFLAASNVNDLKEQRVRVAAQLEKAQTGNEERLRVSLTDTLSDLDARILNVEKGLKDAEYIDVELQRIEGKVHALAELAITRQDPSDLSAQVTAFAETLKMSQDMEARMGSLEGLELSSADAPPILSAARVGRVRE